MICELFFLRIDWAFRPALEYWAITDVWHVIFPQYGQALLICGPLLGFHCCFFLRHGSLQSHREEQKAQKAHGSKALSHTNDHDLQELVMRRRNGDRKANKEFSYIKCQ